jgi:two-component system NtrC family sensor kinase
MSRETRTRRLTPPSARVSSSTPDQASLPLVSLLANAARLTDVLPSLHQYALQVTGGSCALLFEQNPRNAVLQATSGYGLDELRADPWVPSDTESALVSETFARRSPTFVSDLDQQMPDLAARLKAPAALIIPLAHGAERSGLLAVGFAEAPKADVVERGVAEVPEAFLATLELFRLRQNEEVQRDIRELLNEFAAGLSTSLNIDAGLDTMCLGANRLFGADRTSVWIHDRRARHLTLQASSDADQVSRGVRVSSDDPHAPAAAAMRRSRAELLSGSHEYDVSTSTVTVPLRGCRRALGTIVFEGVRVETGGELDLLDRADELGKQLSSAIENMQLLEDVIRSRRELENTFDSIAHLVVVSDRRGRIVHANAAFANRVNLPREALVDRPLVSCIGPELAGWLAELDGSLRSSGLPAVCEIVDSVLNGPFMVTVTDLLDQERTRVGHVLVARDLTPQSKLEAEREELRKRLTQSEKLAALGQFVAGIAHELNNPLQSVLGHLELLRATGAFPRQLRQEIQTIYREADRAAKIVRNLLVFTGSRRLVRRPVNLNALLQRVLASRQATFRAHEIEIVRHYDEKLPRLKGDPLLLHQVFLNMVMNAEQALATAGRPGRIEITTAIKRGKGVVVTVRDTGDGIPVEALSRIFEPFYTTKEVGKGTGLGLAIAYGIVQEHGGHIAAANHPEGGAVFTVELPSGDQHD